MPNMKSWLPLGVATLAVAPQSLTTLFPAFRDVNNNVYALQVQTHESNEDSDLVYIGDGLLDASFVQAGVCLKGPLVSQKFENQASNNSLDLDDFFLNTNTAEAKVRIYALTA